MIIYDVHYLAFTCETFYSPMRGRLSGFYGTAFSQFDDISSKCHGHQALKQLPDNSVHYDKLLNEFMEISVEPDSKLEQLRDWNLRLIWGQIAVTYTSLDEILCEVYRTSASSSGIEGNHKVNKLVQSSRGALIGEGKVQKLVEIVHYECQLTRHVKKKRASFEYVIEKVAQTPPATTDESSDQTDVCHEFLSDEEDGYDLEFVILSAGCPSEIFDSSIFNEK